jgi:DNA-directed RNA polymerase specialized sigma subunit
MGFFCVSQYTLICGKSLRFIHGTEQLHLFLHGGFDGLKAGSQQLAGVKAGLESELGREPTIDELADRTGISPARIEKINKYRNVQSESSMLTEKGDTLFERKKDPHKIWAEYVYHDLDPVDKKIYEWSTGYGGNETYKKGEIARRLNMSAPAVSQRINKIIAKLEEGYFLE